MEKKVTSVIDKEGELEEAGKKVSVKKVAKHCVYLNVICGLRDHATDSLEMNFPHLTEEERNAIEDEIDNVIDRLTKMTNTW